MKPVPAVVIQKRERRCNLLNRRHVPVSVGACVICREIADGYNKANGAECHHELSEQNEAVIIVGRSNVSGHTSMKLPRLGAVVKSEHRISDHSTGESERNIRSIGQ